MAARLACLLACILWTKTACISTSTSTSPSPLPPLSGSIHQQSVAVSHFLPLLTLALSLAACSQLSLAAHLCQALGQDETIQAKLTTRRRQRSTTTTAPPTCPDTSVAKPPDAVTHPALPRSPVSPSLLTPHPASQPDGEVPSLSIPHPTRDRPPTTTSASTPRSHRALTHPPQRPHRHSLRHVQISPLRPASPRPRPVDSTDPRVPQGVSEGLRAILHTAPTTCDQCLHGPAHLHKRYVGLLLTLSAVLHRPHGDLGAAGSARLPCCVCDKAAGPPPTWTSPC